MRLTVKELKRASSDGIVIVSRPNRSEGGYNVMAVCIHSMRIRGWQWHVESKSDIADAATSIQRDLDKFLGVGGKMSSKGRLRPGIKQNKLRAISNAD